MKYCIQKRCNRCKQNAQLNHIVPCNIIVHKYSLPSGSWIDRLPFKVCPYIRTRLHKRMRTSFQQIFSHTALKMLAIHKYACAFLPCLRKNCAWKSAHISCEDGFSELYLYLIIILEISMVTILRTAPPDIT